VALATFYLATGRTQDAERVVNEALTIDPAHQQGNRLLALIYLGTRRANEAERPLKAMVREYDGQSRLALADYYIGMRRMDDAVPILKDLLNRPLTRSDATLRLASIDYSAGRKVDASKSVDALLVKEPRNVRALALKARWQLAAGNINGAVETARAATKADASWADAHYVLGVALVAKRDNPEAATSLKEAIRLNPRFVAAQVLLSRVQLASGDVVAAVQSAQDAKKQAPTNLDAQLVLVRGLLTKGDLVAAEPEVRALLAKYPKNASAHTMNGFLLLGKKDEAGARAAFRRAVDLNPALPEPLEGLLTLDARAHKLPDAVHRIEGTLAATPDNPNLLIVAARTYGAAGQVDKKEKALRRVIELDPDNMPAYLLLGQTYVATKKLDEAVAQYDAVAKRHENIGASTMAAILVDMQHRREDAIKRYEAIVATHQRAPVAANNLAWIYAERGDNLEMALQLAQDAKSQLPNTPAVSDTLGWIYYKKGLPQLAIEPLEDSVAKDPNNATYRYHLGLAYAKAGQKEKARVALERALQLSPQFDGASTARETLESLKS
jgi:tetratricopeptide (TPR) repeat protein